MKQTCEAIQISLSALIDGELEPVEVAPAIDHLVDCTACRSFYSQARAIDGLALAATASSHAEPAPAAVWERIQAERAPKRATRRISRNVPAWASAVAASLVLAVGLSIVALEGTRQSIDTGGADSMLVAGRVQMSDERFVELALEVLQADRRYQKEMFEVMQAVNSRSARREGTPETTYRENHEVESPALETAGRGGDGAPSGPRS